VMGARLLALLTTCWLAACATAPLEPSKGHVEAPPPRAGSIPPPVGRLVMPPPPKPTPRAERYTVVVNNVAVRELLFAVARDAKVNVDIHPGIQGNVTLNAVDQTLPQILARIAKQVDMRFELDGANLAVMPDTPYLRSYKIDYVNIARSASRDRARRATICRPAVSRATSPVRIFPSCPTTSFGKH
jgi:type II secretory pathway component GspD/PulD (secretin)